MRACTAGLLCSCCSLVWLIFGFCWGVITGAYLLPCDEDFTHPQIRELGLSQIRKNLEKQAAEEKFEKKKKQRERKEL